MGAPKTHGLTQHPLYAVWFSMKSRCLTTTHHAFKDYGGRGIGVSSAWLEFEPFYEWAVAAGWTPGLSLERRNNELGYCAANCHFATKAQQAHNRRDNKLNWTLVHWIRRGYQLGVTQQELADIFGVNQQTISKIVRNKQWVK